MNRLNPSENEYCVCLTACIDPSGGLIKLQRHDPAVRLNDYLKAMRFWLNLPDERLNKIVFVENSGYPLDELSDICKTQNPFGKKVELISSSTNSYPEGVHYGYAELHSIEQAFDRSQLLKSSTYFIKATGRLRFPNISQLLDLLPDEYLFSVDCRARSRYGKSDPFATTQLMVFSTSFYRQHLLHSKSELSNELGLIEILIYEKLIAFKDQQGAILRWKVNVDPVGYAGEWQKKYHSPKQRLINSARFICRHAFPDWWI
ncbi:hypothetical protein BH10ACI2_BH10ACI2_09150 [soil metagenome]